MEAAFPQLGPEATDATYALRPGGYAVILSNDGKVGVVSTPLGLALPGGGQGPRESAENAAVRETQEECGLRIALGRYIGIADELVFAADEGKHYRKRCTFFLAKVIERSGPGELDHELTWLSMIDAMEKHMHGSQRWAVAQAGNPTKRGN